MQKRGQASVEYLAIVGIVLVVTIPLFFYSFQKSSENIKINQADDAVNTVARAADSVYALGPGAKKFVWVTIPQGTTGSSINNNTIQLQITIFGGISDVHASSKANLIGFMPYEQGIYKIPIESLDSGYVQIGLGNDTQPPFVVFTSPSGYICNQYVTLKANTNEPAFCKYDTLDNEYDAMVFDFVGNALTHEKILGFQPESSYLYYIRCRDPSNNTMTDSVTLSYTINLEVCSQGPTQCDENSLWADTVESYQVGFQKNGQPVPPDYSDPTKALGPAIDNLTEGTYYSLGYGNATYEAYITLGFFNYIYNEPGYDIQLVESSPASTDDEVVIIKVSQNGTEWLSLGSHTGDELIDISDYHPNVSWVRYVQLIDDIYASTYKKYSNPAAAYDINGIKALNCGGQSAPECTPGDYSTPNIILAAPPNNTVDSDGILTFKFNVSDDSPVSFCQLILNNDVYQLISPPIYRNQTNNITLGGLDYGNYTWYMNCTDNCGYRGASQKWKFHSSYVQDYGIPIVTLKSPPDNHIRNFWLVKFIYNVSDVDSSIAYCYLNLQGNLILNNTILMNIKDSPIQENVDEEITIPLFKGNYTWNVSCTDSSYFANVGISSTRKLIINVTAGESAYLDSCGGVCGNIGYLDGQCVQNCGGSCAGTCQSAGDQYCTIGPPTPNCCCYS